MGVVDNQKILWMFNYISDDSAIKQKEQSDVDNILGLIDSDNKSNPLQGTPSIIEYNP